MKNNPVIRADMLSGMDQVQLKEFGDQFRSCINVREILILSLEKAVDELVKQDEHKSNYDSLQYIGLHADNIGERRGLRKAIALLKGKDNGK